MKHTHRDSIPLDKLPPFTLRKAGLLAGAGLFVSMCVTDVREKVGDILFGKSPQSESVFVSPNKTAEEAARIAAEWDETSKDQILTSYHIKKGDTLSQIAQKHGVTLESILNVNPKITSVDSIHMGDTLLIPKMTSLQPLKSTRSPMSPPSIKKSLPENGERDDGDVRSLTMIFEGFSPQMKIDTQDNNKTTYAIGYGTNIGTLQADYPFGSYGKDVAEYLKRQGHSTEGIKQIMHCKKDISRAEARDLFEMRYVDRYQKIRAQCGKNWAKYPPVIRNMLVDMSYNMGENAIFPNKNNQGFPDAVAALNRGDWVGYINAVVDSKYARDVGPRRLGKWIALVVRDVLKGKTAGLSQEAINMHSTYTVKHSRDLNSQIAKLD